MTEQERAAVLSALIHGHQGNRKSRMHLLSRDDAALLVKLLDAYANQTQSDGNTYLPDEIGVVVGNTAATWDARSVGAEATRQADLREAIKSIDCEGTPLQYVLSFGLNAAGYETPDEAVDGVVDTVIALLPHRDASDVRCVGCGSKMTDADLERERIKRGAEFLSCCPERKPLTIDQWQERAERFERLYRAAAGMEG